jgi:ribonuclease HI
VTGVLAENALNIYTDGSSFSSPRTGGVGMRFVLVDAHGQEQVQDLCPPGYKGATNNQMELKACVVALNEARRLGLGQGVGRIVIHTDSMYVYENCGKAMFEWPRTRWCTRSGTPVLNAELWKDLIKAMKTAGCRVEFEWVQGHSKDQHNRALDKMARQSAKAPVHPPLSQVSVRRKRSSESVALGSVAMLSQMLSIRVITSEYLHTQRVWKLKYEVISKASPYRGKVDVIFSDDLLKDGHSYRVRVNDNTRNPRIAKVLGEVPS